jgi:hypothetical protein
MLRVRRENLQPGASSVISLELHVPATVQKLHLNERGTFQDELGKVYKFSLGQVVSP